MFRAEINSEKNRLYLYLGNIEEKEDFSHAVSETERLVRFLRQGFTCISDLRGFTFKDNDHYFMQSIQETLWDAGVKLVIRVIDEKSIKTFCFEKKSLVWPGYQIETAFTIEEAEIILSRVGL
ncbi:MAG: hypothetical protein RBR08_05500 [Desulforegulaceae bacterium]|nr:hypothetical protein [Desulforegulaceae bacterium]